jgi:hypothetical protein
MITCSNCTHEAELQYNVSETSKIPYCAFHLPKFLRKGQPSALLVSKVEAPAVIKKTSRKDPEPVVEEPTEETVEETDGTD